MIETVLKLETGFELLGKKKMSFKVFALMRQMTALPHIYSGGILLWFLILCTLKPLEPKDKF